MLEMAIGPGCHEGPGVDPVAGRDYSNQSFDVGGSLRLSWDDRSTFMDASCEAVHGVGAMQCYDNLHVLLDHVDTSFFIYAEQNDGTVSDRIGWADDRDAVVMPSPHWVTGDGTTVQCGHPHLDDGTLLP